jgi:hypothetical protein
MWQSVQSAGTDGPGQRTGPAAGARPLGGLTAPPQAGQRLKFLAAISNVYL